MEEEAAKRGTLNPMRDLQNTFSDYQMISGDLIIFQISAPDCIKDILKHKAEMKGDVWYDNINDYVLSQVRQHKVKIKYRGSNTKDPNWDDLVEYLVDLKKKEKKNDNGLWRQKLQNQYRNHLKQAKQTEFWIDDQCTLTSVRKKLAHYLQISDDSFIQLLEER